MMFKPKYDCIAREIIHFPNEVLTLFNSKSFYKQYKTDQNGFPGYTNFGNHKQTDEEKQLYDKLNLYYGEIIANFMNSINYSSAEYGWEWWFQIYEPGSKGFTPHAHSTECKFTISWCHFIQPSKDSNFCWYYDKSNIKPINEQKNELVFFPGWIFHKVLPNKYDKNRITIAGNINVVKSNGYIIETD